MTFAYQGYAEHMRAMFGRDDMDPPRQEPQRQEQQSMGSSPRGSSSQYTHPNLGWQSRLGQSVPAFPGSRIIPTCRVDLWPKPLTEMTVVKLSYQLKLTNHTILYKSD